MGMITPVAIGRVFVGEEPDDEDIFILAASGFRSIVCLTREPAAGEPLEDRERAAADAARLAFVRLPLSSAVTPQMVRAFREVMRMLPRPIYLHCGFGRDAAALALVAEADDLPDPTIVIDTLVARGIRMPPNLIAEVARLRAEITRIDRRTAAVVPTSGWARAPKIRPWRDEFSAATASHASSRLAFGAFTR
jgi:protein tyrosine phosphatase (PTP) superfamily phosphohydrolase (DUF442 family)